LRLCSNEQLLELLAWFGLTGNDDHFADIVDDDIIDVNDVSPLLAPRIDFAPAWDLSAELFFTPPLLRSFCSCCRPLAPAAAPSPSPTTRASTTRARSGARAS